MNPVIEIKNDIVTPENLYAFEPSAGRVKFLDERMRLRLRDSLAYIWNQAEGALELPAERFQDFLVQLAENPISPLAFSFYSDAVMAIEEDKIAEAANLLEQLICLPVQAAGPLIKTLGNPKMDEASARYARFIDSDPSVRFEIFPPSAESAAHCRLLIEKAFALMDQGDPDLAGEIRGLLREIILAAGSDDPKALVFDGASSFMLWGGIILNANHRNDILEMVQMLAHESAHNLMFGLSADESLVENSVEELFPSPLRVDPRPMDGIYHATFVTARMYRAVKTLVDSGVLSGAQLETAKKDLAENARLFAKGIKVVNEHGKLSAAGKALMDGANDYMVRTGK